MGSIKTKYGEINSAIIYGCYDTGEPEYYKIKEKNHLDILGYKLVPDFSDDIVSLSVYKNGNIRSIILENPTTIITQIGVYTVNKINFYKTGMISKLFLSRSIDKGIYSQEEKVRVARNYTLSLKCGIVRGKIEFLDFYRTGGLKRIVFFNGEKGSISNHIVNIEVKNDLFLFENGIMSSCEPIDGQVVITPIGNLISYNRGEDEKNLKFNSDSSIKQMTTKSLIKISGENNETINLENKNGLDVSFESEGIVIENKIYKYLDNNFYIENN